MKGSPLDPDRAWCDWCCTWAHLCTCAQLSSIAHLSPESRRAQKSRREGYINRRIGARIQRGDYDR